MISFVKKTMSGLSKTRSNIGHFFAGLSGKSYLDETDLEQLEEDLLAADLGWELTNIIIESLKSRDKKDINLGERFKLVINEYLEDCGQMRKLKKVILLVGVNGTGKTTSAAKLGGYYSKMGESVSLIAADTYRAAAVEQISLWSKSLNLHLVANEKSSDREEKSRICYDHIEKSRRVLLSYVYMLLAY